MIGLRLLGVRRILESTLLAVAMLALLLSTSRTARADECLEVGFMNSAGDYAYYRATVADQDDNLLILNYDHHGGEVILKIFTKGPNDIVVMKGTWTEEDAGKKTGGKVRVEAGEHTAKGTFKGWYTIGDAPDAWHSKFKLRDC